MSFLLNNKKIELNNMTDINSNIKGMNLTKLTKQELLAKCEENGFKKCKSKNKEELINLLENKLVEKNKIKLIIEDDEEEIKNEIITKQELEITSGYPYKDGDQDKLEELLILTDEELLFWESIGVSPTYMFEDYGIADEFSYDIKTQRSISQ